MKNILSEKEISALLDGMQNNNLPETNYTEILTENFDYEKLKKYNRSKLPALDIIGERYSKILAYSLAENFNLEVEIEKEDLKIVSFNDVLKNKNSDFTFHSFSTNCLTGEFYLGLDNNFLFYLIDIYLLGQGRKYQKDYGFTILESRIINKIVKLCLKAFSKAWEAIYYLEFKYLNFKSNSVLKAFNSNNKKFYLTAYNLKLKGFETKILFCLPVLSLEPLKSVLKTDVYSVEYEAPNKQERLKKHLMEIDLNLSVELNNFQISAQNLMSFTEGETLMLHKDVKDDLNLKVSGVQKFKVIAGTRRGKNAVKISG